MSFFTDVARNLGKKVTKSGGITGTAAKIASGGKYSVPNSESIQNTPWMNAANAMFDNVKNTANKVGSGQQPGQQQAPAAGQQTNQQQGLVPLKQQTPGKNGYTPTTAPYGMDQSNPGVQEQYWNQNQNLWNKGMSAGPGQGEQFWNQVQGNYNKASQDLTPQFNQYYDQAKSTAMGDANKQAAARGVYGSSQALNNVGNVAADVEGQRAKASTDFMFNNAANQNQALSNYGNMAFGAQGMNNNRNAMDLTALNSGYQAAGQAQNQRNNRVQGQFNNAQSMAGMYLPFLQNQQNGMLQNDQDLYTGATNAGPAATQQALNQQQTNRQQNSQDLGMGLSLYGAFGGGGGNGQSNPNPGYNSNYGGYARNY